MVSSDQYKMRIHINDGYHGSCMVVLLLVIIDSEVNRIDSEGAMMIIVILLTIVTEWAKVWELASTQDGFHSG